MQRASAGVDELDVIDAYWRAADCLSAGPIYLLGNPLLREPLAAYHIKPRLLSHWGTCPGLNLIYAHLNRLIRSHDQFTVFIGGLGHSGSAMVANAYLKGTFSEVYPQVEQSEDGLRELMHRFSFPGGIANHVGPEVPGSIHEGGESGYALAYAYGAALDNPDLLVCCVIGDGEVPGDQDMAVDGRVMEILSEHLCQGWLEGYLLTGRHGVFNSYEAFVHIIDSMLNQRAKWLKLSRELPWREPIASLNYLLSSHLWRLRSRHRVNGVVAAKNDVPVWLSPDEAIDHLGIGAWEWAGTELAVEHTREYGDDVPEIRDWTWAAAR